MKDFTVSSMTQSFASVTSLPRDTSCEDFDSSSADKTIIEDLDSQVRSQILFHASDQQDGILHIHAVLLI